MKAPVSYKRKVRYSDTDAQGHVFNVSYFTYFDDAITDFMEIALGGMKPEEAGYEIVLARAECDFASSGQLTEVLVTNVMVEKIGNKSITFALEVTEEATGRVVAKGREIYVTVTLDLSTPITVPDRLREAIGRMQGE
jgi:YbgC/YbaW family acyl-CoA thioester hydrolase